MSRLPAIFVIIWLLAAVGAEARSARNSGEAPVEVVIEGLQHYSERQARELLHEQIAGLQQEGLTLAGADDTAFYLELNLRNDGYDEAFVDYKIVNPQKLVLTVEEGVRTTIKEVVYEGGKTIPQETMDLYLLGPIRERSSALDGALPFVPTLLDEGAGLLERYLIEQGYRDAIVAPPHFDLNSETNQVTVHVLIQEGRQYHFGDIEFSGDLIFGPDELLRQLREQTLRPFSLARQEALTRRLQAFYVEQGYYEAVITLEPLPLPPNTTEVPIRFLIEPGPKFEIAELRIVSTDRLSPAFFQRRFGSLVGKHYDPRRLEGIYRQLLQTGIFARLRATPVKTGPDTLALEIEAVEAKTKEFGVYGGFGSYEGFIIGGSVQDLSVFNTGRSGRIDAEMTGRGFRGSATYEDPWFLESPVGFLARASYAELDRDDYDKRTIGARLSWSYDWKGLEIGAGFQPRHSEIFNTLLTPAQTGPTNYFINSAGLALVYDRRDNRFNPSKGWVVGVSADYATEAIGSEIDFTRLNYRAAYFVPIGPVVLSLAVQGGVIYAEGSTTIIPIDERFFSGGSTTVRSFGERELTPRTIFGQALGGNTTTVYNVEVDFPLFEELRGAVFFDAGNVVQGSSPFSFDDMRYGIGAGLRFALPVGMFRLDYGVNPDPSATEAFGAFHFGFGFLF